MKKTAKIALVVIAVLMLFSATGCRRVLLEEDQARSLDDRAGSFGVGDTVDIDLEGAEELDARIGMGAGQLAVSGGAEDGKALTGELDYSPSGWEPRVAYRVEDGRGILQVNPPSARLNFGEMRNAWDLQLPSDLPLRLDLELGAGDGDIDLTGMMLQELELDLGAGEAKVDLSGEWKNDLKARIEAGVGRLEIKVPENVGVRITGDRQGIGEFRAEGFSEDGGDLVNDAWDTAEYKLDIELNQGVGEIVVETVR